MKKIRENEVSDIVDQEVAAMDSDIIPVKV